jgi:hypothetical protein
MKLNWSQKLGEPFYILEITHEKCCLWLISYNDGKQTWTIEDYYHKLWPRNFLFFFADAPEKIALQDQLIKSTLEEIFYQLEFQTSLRLSQVILMIGDIFITGALNQHSRQEIESYQQQQLYLTFEESVSDFSSAHQYMPLPTPLQYKKNKKKILHESYFDHSGIFAPSMRDCQHMMEKQQNTEAQEPHFQADLFYYYNTALSHGFVKKIENILNSMSFSLQSYDMSSYFSILFQLKPREWYENCFVINLDHDMTGIFLMCNGNVIGFWKHEGILCLIDAALQELFCLSAEKSRSLRRHCGFCIDLWENEDTYDIFSSHIEAQFLQNHSMPQLIGQIQYLFTLHFQPLLDFLEHIMNQKEYEFLQKSYHFVWMGEGASLRGLNSFLWSKMEGESHRIINQEIIDHAMQLHLLRFPYHFCKNIIVQHQGVFTFFADAARHNSWSALMGCLKTLQSWC